jgi:hypothetical protein
MSHLLFSIESSSQQLENLEIKKKNLYINNLNLRIYLVVIT